MLRQISNLSINKLAFFSFNIILIVSLKINKILLKQFFEKLAYFVQLFRPWSLAD